MQSAAAASGNSAKPTVSGVSVTLLVSLLLPPPVTAAGSAPDLGAGAASGNWLHAQMSTKMSRLACLVLARRDGGAWRKAVFCAAHVMSLLL